ncbi:hypothetical protein I4U23_027347 [Adineta vaga]|nr:hypothetical protein I4U23_027347 [Adineta vaga]
MINEIMFIFDCSRSIDSENKIELARQAMLFCIKSLPVDHYFNIIRFDSNYEKLFDDIKAIYNDDNVQKAHHFIENIKGDLDGTEMLLLLQWLNIHSSSKGHSRQIFLLTNGEISNTDEVLSLCRSISTSTRIFSFGSGYSPIVNHLSKINIEIK